MLIREQGVVIGDVLYERAFQKAPVHFDDALPDDYAPSEEDQWVEPLAE